VTSSFYCIECLLQLFSYIIIFFLVFPYKQEIPFESQDTNALQSLGNYSFNKKTGWRVLNTIL